MRWFGAWPDKLVDLRGAGVDATIDRIEAAVKAYPYPDTYRAWPGPNSNTFTRVRPRAACPSCGSTCRQRARKDWIPGGIFDRTPSGTGYQLSIAGVFGVQLALEERLRAEPAGAVGGRGPERPGTAAARVRARGAGTRAGVGETPVGVSEAPAGGTATPAKDEVVQAQARSAGGTPD